MTTSGKNRDDPDQNKSLGFFLRIPDVLSLACPQVIFATKLGASGRHQVSACVLDSHFRESESSTSLRINLVFQRTPKQGQNRPSIITLHQRESPRLKEMYTQVTKQELGSCGPKKKHGLRSRKVRLSSQHCYYLASGIWENHFTSLSFSFLTCKLSS